MRRQIVLITLLAVALVGAACSQSLPRSSATTDAAAEIPKAVLDTSSWKTYKTEQYGYEFKYPSDWTVNNSLPFMQGRLDGAVFSPPGPPYELMGIDITVEQPINVDDWIRRAENTNRMQNNGLGKITQSKMNVGGEVARKIEVNQPLTSTGPDVIKYSVSAFIPHNKLTYTLSMEATINYPNNDYKKTTMEEAQSLYSTLLSTLKFMQPAAPVGR